MQSPFDIMAETYDVNFTNSSIGQLQRQQVWEALTVLLKSYQRRVRILEINCGTGEDALNLSRAGHFVTATDGSAKMIEKAVQKADLAGAENICFRVCTFERLHDVFAGNKFDLIISNFGGLNCIDGKKLEELGQQLHSLLDRDGQLFLVLMTRACVWEILYYVSKGKLNTAFRRRRKSVLFKTSETELPIYYYSPSVVRKLFSMGYHYRSSFPVGLFIPPSYLQHAFVNRPRWLNNLARLEKRCRHSSLFANLADHFCIVFQKNAAV